METVADFILLGSIITVDGECSHEIQTLTPWRKAMTNLDSILKSRDITLPTKVCIIKATVFPGVMYRCWELDHKEGWTLKNWCFLTVVLQKTLESPLRETKPVNPKGNQHWISTGRTDIEAEALILWCTDVKSQLIGKDPDAGKDWRDEEKGAAEDEMVGWHHRLNGYDFEQTLKDSEGQASPPAAVHGVIKSWRWLSD